eukprot:CAMPEP_0185005080 /NCGR_PEP_ID=MMETSP1098-20130426/80943_1 /TAXON_ID=89044 /ORGANISM="Spumella elongata, Strain CCAP 955/1" /LENGTH=34 /DNA_ID= /DNA_START= /DNA_END= /DNA_ORIENTATION=
MHQLSAVAITGRERDRGRTGQDGLQRGELVLDLR